MANDPQKPKRSLADISPLRRLRTKEREIDDEMLFHLEMEERKLREQGLSEADARRQARLRFGGQGKWRDEVRDVDGIGPFERLMADLRFGLRVLKRSPVFTVVSILTLALGIGASTAIFSVVDGILLRALPYAEAGELVTVWADYTKRNGPEREWWGYPNFHDVRKETALSALEPGAVADAVTDPVTDGRVFEDMALWTGWGPTLTGNSGGAEQLQGARVSQGMLSNVLRVAPIKGSLFRPEDDVPGASQVALISERLWQRSFGGDPNILGRSLTLSGETFTVLGVLPGEFRQPFIPQAEIWTVPRIDITDYPGGRGSAMMRVVGRLAPEASLDQARARLQQVAAALEQAYPEDLTNVGATAFPLKDDIVAGSRSGLLLLLAAVVATLLIVCINLANLLLARGNARLREFSLRAALGASSGRLARQLLTESLLLAGLGGALGVALAIAGTRLLVSLAPAGTPRIEEVGVDNRVLLFCTAVSLLCGLLFGLLPALQAARSRIASRIGRNREGGERASEFLVAGQVAAALVLLIGAGLLLQSFTKLARTDLGYRAEGLISVSVTAPSARFPEMEQASEYLDNVEAELSSIAGVEKIARGDTLPLSGANGDLTYNIEGRDVPDPGEEDIAWFRRATPGYFATLGIELVSGRAIATTDSADAVPVVLINETLAQRQFGNQDPVGQRLNINDPSEPKWREIIGVVGDIKNFDLREQARPAMYLPFAQVQTRRAFLALRTGGDEDQLLRSVQQRLRAFDPDAVPVIQAANSLVEGARSLDRFVAWLLSLFAGVALTLAAVGLYGVISYRVSQRTVEIGLRLALGAPASTIGRWVISRSLRISLVGVVLGLGLGALAARSLRSQLFEIEPTDPLTFAGLAVVMIIVACLASGVPAWRAARLDPATVLKAE